MGINEAVTAIETFLRTYEGGGAKVIATQVRPSGDDVDVIKIWCDLGDTTVDRAAWKRTAEAAVAKALPEATMFRLMIFAE
jgi:hypothetical protein